MNWIEGGSNNHQDLFDETKRGSFFHGTRGKRENDLGQQFNQGNNHHQERFIKTKG